MRSGSALRQPVVTVFLALAGCGGNDTQCVQLSADCAPLYEPTFDNVFSQTLEPKCGLSSCHDARAARAGLVFETPDTAHDSLLQSRVEPSNLGCGLLDRRIESTNPAFVMPPGQMLSEPERCAIRQWIDRGAPR